MSPSRKIAYTAAATAIAVLFALATLFTPVKVVPLLVCSFCFYIAAIAGGIGFGLISIVATALITFFAGGGLSVTAILLFVVFTPYSIIAYFLRKVKLKSKMMILRVAIMAVFINLALVAVYFLVKVIVFSSNDMNILAMISKLGGYWVFAIIVTVLFLSFDFLFIQMAAYIPKYLKQLFKGKKGKATQTKQNNAQSENDKTQATQTQQDIKNIDPFDFTPSEVGKENSSITEQDKEQSKSPDESSKK